MSKIWDWIKEQLRDDDDWSDILGDPFIPRDYKLYLMKRFPEKFPHLAPPKRRAA